MTLAITGGVLVALATAALFARRRYAVVTVDGVSMQPTLREGDRVLVRRVSLARVRRGQIVVVERPLPPGGVRTGGRPLDRRRWLIKRAAALPGEPVPPEVGSAVGAPAGAQVPRGHLVVLGDNPSASADSRMYGYIPADRLLGVVIRPLR